MKKIILSIVFVIAAYLGAISQGLKGFKLQAGANVASPADITALASVGVGLDLLGMYGVIAKVGITADVGFTSIFAIGNGINVNIIPLRAGARFYPNKNFYVAGKSGIGIVTRRGSSYNTTTYSFGAGYIISSATEISASYDDYSSRSFFGIVNVRLGYTFGKN